ncbi:MAG TPA: FtsW/RodA/SpoVE family cell cycle protein [Anaerolineae bacterium]|jgi:rod shape determining protein RodA|nr:FtsW/RodA/SpoVE family cell cycle protein [Anaerolineae bacterium]
MKSTSVWRHFDLWLTAAVLVLTAYGILAINSAVTGAPAFETYPERQVLFALIGVAVMLIFSAIDYRILTSSHWYIYAFFIASLVIVYLVGVINNASRRWIDLGVIQIQPSEFGRIILAITLAQFLLTRQHLMGRFSNTLVTLAYVGLPVAFIFLQPDLGMSIIFFVVWFVLIWLAGLPLSHFALLSAIAILAAVVLFPSLADYQQLRFIGWLNPEALPEESFNIEQALISIGSGGWWGKGYLQGTQSQLGFLRVQHTDFIFSVITEEMGLVFGALVVLGLMTFILIRIVRVASLTGDPAGRFIVVGIAAVLFFQTVVSVGMNLRLLPVTGLTLPFVSYGGSSLITLFMAIGIVQSVLMRHRKQEFG